MPKKMNYIIKKLEKGPLQRFKNQNLLLKKFGEVGLKIYRAITGRRTVEELKKDLALDDAMFDPVIDYMTEAGMAELIPEGKKEEKKPEAPAEEIEAPAEEPEEEVEPEEPEEAPEEIEEEAPEEEIPEEEEIEIEKEEPKKPKKEEEGFFDEIEPIRPEGMEIEPEEEEEPEEEVEPIEAEEEKEEEPEEPVEEEEEEEIEAEGEEEEPGIDFESEEEKEEEEELSSVEKIIKDKYGDTGVQVYNLIDGEKTAEEIMRDVGVSESKLIEILDFMDKQGIIKLEYPGEKKAGKPTAPVSSEEPSTGFVPILETERVSKSKEVTIPNPVEVPALVSGDIIKSVQMKARVMLKYKDEGKRVFNLIDGKKDVIDIALKSGTSLPVVYDVLNFLMEGSMIVLKPMLREYVKKKYGDDGYSIYKRFRREGLMLYGLIGRDMTFKQMAELVTKDKERAVDMFLFIHEVLGIELPIDRDVLARQLGV